MFEGRGCNAKPESREHLLAKARIALAAVSAHWEAVKLAPGG
jgi:hypothetical protein